MVSYSLPDGTVVGAKVGVDLGGIVVAGLGWVGMGEGSEVKLGV